MFDTVSNKEFDDLPEAIKTWGNQAISKIISPEKRAEAVKVLRKDIDHLWDECVEENVEEKIEYVLSKLGDAELMAEKMKKTYIIKENPRKDKIMGIISLILSGIFAIYPLKYFFVYARNNSNDISIYGGYITGDGVFSGIACAIFLFLFGVWLLLHTRKKGR